MQIELPTPEQERLAQHAAAGYDDVQLWAAEVLIAQARQPTPDELPALSEAELQASVARCERGIAEIKAGGGHDFRKAMFELGRNRGFPLPE